MKLKSRFQALFVVGLLTTVSSAEAASNYSIPYAFSNPAGDSSIGSSDGPGNVARFYAPRGIAIDLAGNLYVADAVNQTIRKITQAGLVSTLAGTAGVFGVGEYMSGRTNLDGTGANAVFSNPEGSADGDLVDARFSAPSGIVVDKSGTIFVSDAGNHLVRRISADGRVSTLGGLALAGGYTNGLGMESRFESPPSLALNATSEKLYITSGATLRLGQATGGAVIITQPQSVSCKARESAQFSVVANGIPAPTYQWYRGSTLVAGATAASL